jgi:hypothetical protein
MFVCVCVCVCYTGSRRSVGDRSIAVRALFYIFYGSGSLSICRTTQTEQEQGGDGCGAIASPPILGHGHVRASHATFFSSVSQNTTPNTETNLVHVV